MSLANIAPEDQMTILNLVNLGVTMMQGSKKKVPKKGSGQGEANYDVSRYVPPLKRIMEEAWTSGLNTLEFPFTRPPSASPDDVHLTEGTRKAKLAAANGANVTATGRRLIVFVLGGVTYSEARGMHEVAAALGRDMILGSTSMLTPQSYLASLKQMRKADGP